MIETFQTTGQMIHLSISLSILIFKQNLNQNAGMCGFLD
jgi:hypothetical protein